MDRLPRRDPNESIIDRGPILIGTEPPKGYNGIRTTVEVRDYRLGHDHNGAHHFMLDAVINTEVRKAPWSSKRPTKYQEQVTHEHHEAIAMLLEAIKEAATLPIADSVIDEDVPPSASQE